MNTQEQTASALRLAKVVMEKDRLRIAELVEQNDALYKALSRFMKLGTMNDQKAIDAARNAIAKVKNYRGKTARKGGAL